MPRGRRYLTAPRKNEQTPSHAKRAVERKAKHGGHEVEQEGAQGASGEGPSNIAVPEPVASSSHDVLPEKVAEDNLPVTNSIGIQCHLTTATRDSEVLAVVETASRYTWTEDLSDTNSIGIQCRITKESKDVEVSALPETASRFTWTVPQAQRNIAVQIPDLAVLDEDPVGNVQTLCLIKFTQKLKMILPKEWTVEGNPTRILIYMLDLQYKTVVKDLTFCSVHDIEISVLNLKLKNNHTLWDCFQFSSTDVDNMCDTIFSIICYIDSLNICSGSLEEKCKDLWDKGVFAKRGSIKADYCSGKLYYRSNSCELLTVKLICSACSNEQVNMVREHNRKLKRAAKDRDLSKVNMRYFAKHELLIALKEARVMNSKFKKDIKILKGKIDILIEQQGQTISDEWSKEFKNITKSNFEKMSPIQKLFWDQQLKAASLTDKRSMKWHPMCIRLALHLHMISSSNFDAMKKSGLLTLPSERTLYDYSHVIKPEEGCQEEVVANIKSEVDKKCQENHEKYMSLSFDEMHIRSSLVYQKSSGELIGYVKLDDVEKEFQNLQNSWTGSEEMKPPVATSVLVFMIKNITGNDPKKSIKSVVAIYSAKSMTATGLYTRVWDVIYFLELCSIPVLSIVCDGASTNRRFIKMHVQKGKGTEVNATVNLTAPGKRILFFIIDAPHLLKTLRTCLANSHYHKMTRSLWRNGEELTWLLIVDYYERHKRDKLRKAHRINGSHVYLTSFSVMNVALAAQILSKTFAKAITDDAVAAEREGKLFPSYKETVLYLEKGNVFFDCLNGHNPSSGIRYNNPNLAPYTDHNDNRFGFLESYVKYFEDWETQVKERDGNFTKRERRRMMISHQTYTGIKITVPSFIGAVRFLLKAGATAVCARRFNQDSLEQMFSIFRRKGGSSNNPDLLQVMQTNMNVHAQGVAALPTRKGNTMVDNDPIEIDDTPLPKRKK